MRPVIFFYITHWYSKFKGWRTALCSPTVCSSLYCRLLVVYLDVCWTETFGFTRHAHLWSLFQQVRNVVPNYKWPFLSPCVTWGCNVTSQCRHFVGKLLTLYSLTNCLRIVRAADFYSWRELPKCKKHQFTWMTTPNPHLAETTFNLEVETKCRAPSKAFKVSRATPCGASTRSSHTGFLMMPHTKIGLIMMMMMMMMMTMMMTKTMTMTTTICCIWW